MRLNINVKHFTVSLVMIIICSVVYSQDPAIIRSTLGTGGLSTSVSGKGEKIIFPQSIGQLSVTGTFMNNGLEFRQGYIQPVKNKNSSSGNSENSGKATFVIYPNPFTSEIYIKHADKKVTSFDFEISELSGRLVRSYVNYSEGLAGIDLGFLQKGIYVLTITDAGKRLHFKIIKN